MLISVAGRYAKVSKEEDLGTIQVEHKGLLDDCFFGRMAGHNRMGSCICRRTPGITFAMWRSGQSELRHQGALLLSKSSNALGDLCKYLSARNLLKVGTHKLCTFEV